MRRRSLLLLLLSVMLLSGSALAQKWVLVGHAKDDINGTYALYVDTDRAVKSGDHLILWEKEVFADPLETAKVHLIREEIQFSTPRQERVIESYQYDDEGETDLISHNTKVLSWYSVDDALENKAIDLARKYAK